MPAFWLLLFIALIGFWAFSFVIFVTISIIFGKPISDAINELKEEFMESLSVDNKKEDK